MDRKNAAHKSAEEKFDIETKGFYLKVKELEEKVIALTEVGFKDLKDENEVLRMKMTDSSEKVHTQSDEIYDLARSNDIQKKINQKLHRELNKLREKNQIEKSKVVKDLKLEIKLWRKSLGIERTAKIKLEKKLRTIEHLLPRKVKTKSTNTTSSFMSNSPHSASDMASSCTTSSKFLISCPVSSEASQTDNHPDVPYQITSPLPPIFNSQLRYFTKPITFLSKSLPSLDAICWASPSDSEDDIDELLSEQYDQDVKDFYTLERERVRREHLLEINNNQEF